MNRTHVGWMITAIVVASLWNAPAIADVVADFAKDSHRVDGMHAVRADAGRDERANKLVATNKKGLLPNYIVRYVSTSENTDTIDYYDSARLVKSCNAGSIAGHAYVPSDVGADWTQVQGVGMTRSTGGPPPPPEHPNDACAVGTPDARRLSAGTYEIRLFDNIVSCDFADQVSPAAIVSVRDSRALFATYERDCTDAFVTFRVHVFDHSGTVTDASFTLTALESPSILLP